MLTDADKYPSIISVCDAMTWGQTLIMELKEWEVLLIIMEYELLV